MKLGLVIKITNGGVAEAMSINKDEKWSDYTDDVRLAINKLKNFDGTGKTIILAKFLGRLGYMLVLVKARPEGIGRGGDNTAAWIHVPAACDISNIEIISALKTVETAISARKEINKEILHKVFDKDYKENDVFISAVSNITSKTDADYGARFYNRDYSLNELLGISIAQKEYSNYNGIFLIDAESGISSSFQELNFEPKKICFVRPVSPTDGFTACFVSQGKYIKFDKAIEIPERTEVHVYWIKQGYKTIEKSFIAKDDNSYRRSLAISPNEYLITVYRSMFNVTSTHGRIIKDFTISINGKPMEGDTMYVSEANLKSEVCLSICADGYSEWKKNVRIKPDMNIQLQNRVYHYEFIIPVYAGETRPKDALITIDTVHKLSNSPIKGYSATYHISEGSENRLSYSDNRGVLYKLKYMGIGFVSCIFAVLLYAGFQVLNEYELQFRWPPLKHIEYQHEPEENEDACSDDSLNVSIKEAIEYLKYNKIWHKDSLETFEVTKGMYDRLNEFDYDGLAEYESGLSGCNRFTEVMTALKNNKDNKYDPNKGKENNNGKYNSDNDFKINIDNYIKWLETEHTPIVEKAEETEPVVNVQTPKTHKSKITNKPVKENSTPTKETDSSKEPKRGGEK